MGPIETAVGRWWCVSGPELVVRLAVVWDWDWDEGSINWESLFSQVQEAGAETREVQLFRRMIDPPCKLAESDWPDASSSSPSAGIGQSSDQGRRNWGPRPDFSTSGTYL